MYKVTNISNIVVGLFIAAEGHLVQVNVPPDEYITVETITGQMYNLLDPAKEVLQMERLEV